MKKNNKIYFYIMIILFMPFNIKAAVYCPANENSASKVKTTVKNDKLIIEYYDFVERHGNNGHETEFGVASAVEACSDDPYNKGFNVSNIQNGQDLLIYGKASDSRCVTRNASGTCIGSWYSYTSEQLPNSATITYGNMIKFQEPNTNPHVHYKRLVVDNSIVCPDPSKIKFVTLGSGNTIWDYHSIGCTPKCDYSSCRCKTKYTAADGINSTTCSKIVAGSSQVCTSWGTTWTSQQVKKWNFY